MKAGNLHYDICQNCELDTDFHIEISIKYDYALK